MTPKQADLIRHSFDAIWPVRRKVAELFYRRFFELAPDAQRLFPSDMERQHLKLMDMIAAIVGALDEHELFQSIIRHTGRQHADLGVKRPHFDAFGDALIWCLEHQFGAAFPPELREAWMTLYDAERSRSPVGEPNRWRARAVDHIDRLPSGIRWRHFYPRRRRVAVALAR